MSRVGRGLARRVRGIGTRRPRRVLVAFGVVVALLAAGVVTLSWYDRRAAQVEQARTAALKAAERQAVTVLSYDFRSINRDLERARSALTGQFLEDFTELTTQVVAPAAKQQQISTSAKVVGSSVVEADPDRAVVLLFVNQTTKTAQAQMPQLSGSRVQLTLVEVDGRWLISELDPI
ncbi:MAG: hypothetical protein ACRDT0_27610 [Pseudonocardiaceae bacterium]